MYQIGSPGRFLKRFSLLGPIAPAAGVAYAEGRSSRMPPSAENDVAKQPLNSLARFRKASARLVLEEQGNCEVPAGCGGVVLRWRNPLANVPVLISLYTPVPADFWLDAAPTTLARVDLAPGRHVIALALAEVDLSAGLLMMASVPEFTQEQGVKVLTGGDTWKYTLDLPTEDWTTLAFNDQVWPVLQVVPTPNLDWSEFRAHACHHCTRLGAACLGLPPSTPQARRKVWIRKIFEVSPLASPAPQA
jgi:hypothetical protein